MEIQFQTHRRKISGRSRTDGVETKEKQNFKAPSDGVKNIANMWILSCRLISDTQLEVSVKNMRTIFLLATMVKDQSRINEEQTRFFTRCSQHHFLETARGEDESAHSQIIAIPATSN